MMQNAVHFFKWSNTTTHNKFLLRASDHYIIAAFLPDKADVLYWSCIQSPVFPPHGLWVLEFMPKAEKCINSLKST